jgi:hypothetical protein
MEAKSEGRFGKQDFRYGTEEEPRLGGQGRYRRS